MGGKAKRLLVIGKDMASSGEHLLFYIRDRISKLHDGDVGGAH